MHPITRITDVNTLYDYLEEALHVVRGLGMQNTVPKLKDLLGLQLVLFRDVYKSGGIPNPAW